MATRPDSELVLSIEPAALERCYLVADILHEEHGEARMEYALLGLSDESDPLHVLATPLLPGQRVTPASVEQSGHDVLRMRAEIEVLSHRLRRRLVPIAFVHRHLTTCDASTTDDEFVRGVFIDQVSTVVSFEETRRVGARAVRGEYALCFSLIVNREREHRLYAVRKDTCPRCGRCEVRYVPARLAPVQRHTRSQLARDLLRAHLREEIAARIVFDRAARAAESTG
jgi:rRNA maturation protein Nop10